MLLTRLKSLTCTTVLFYLFAAISANPAFAGGNLLLYGGSGHNVFLGCFTCGKFD